MALSPCPECKKEVSAEAKTCPNCGFRIKKSVRIVEGCGFLLLGLVGVIVVVVVALPTVPPPPPENQAWRRCQSFIQDSLRDPDSAEFITGYSPKLVSSNPDGSYSTFMKVRATNGFGGKTVSIFICKTKPYGDRWALVDLMETK